mmetsp:Transcript_60950/g.161866  ORF Transcript_60950/g.161866 Transcript_60950/m.161866 type:complete len:151 (-) Transcript_60950:232-684(-)|eukprot:CAMPEP_0194509594 /NCGR_PEP_ID=MMETSP0253-20130528/40492_1 /TAXON_ID=2966 /ORGANISM="Noctiluca scintillans" /LENGTH=150 /DNA_ID=CAMNT_0039352765 /DNA_START=38 /DNA_END=490 /DNA_ORIENTATION=+
MVDHADVEGDQGWFGKASWEIVLRNTFIDVISPASDVPRRRAKSVPSLPCLKFLDRDDPPSPATHGDAEDDSPTSSRQPEPSAGSVGHEVGNCKPCAFFYKPYGCDKGMRCTFCHMCTPGEKKRRIRYMRDQRLGAALQRAISLCLEGPP